MRCPWPLAALEEHRPLAAARGDRLTVLLHPGVLGTHLSSGGTEMRRAQGRVMGGTLRTETHKRTMAGAPRMAAGNRKQNRPVGRDTGRQAHRASTMRRVRVWSSFLFPGQRRGRATGSLHTPLPGTLKLDMSTRAVEGDRLTPMTIWQQMFNRCTHARAHAMKPLILGNNA